MRYFLLIVFCGLMSLQGYAQADDLSLPITPVDEGNADILHILLIGSATNNGNNNPGLTDTLLIVSLNRGTGQTAIVSIPRDLYVYIPDRGMYKINQTYFLAEQAATGTGLDSLKATILHNLGIAIDYYARVDFNSFGSLIDSLGGIELAVDCSIRDWRLIEDDLDKTDPDNWEMFTLWSGRHDMDGSLALWYVRSRRTSSDFDRNRRQQDVLRAIWRKIRSEGMLENFPELWEQFNEIVETDIGLTEALGLVPLVLDLEPSQIAYYTFRLKHEVENGYTEEEGRFILIPHRAAVHDLMQTVVTAPNRNRLSTSIPTVAVYNGSGVVGMAFVAAERLEREGFQTFVQFEAVQPRQYNLIVDHTGASRNNPTPILQRVLRVTDAGVQVRPDPQREFDFEIYLGATYPYNSCTYAVEQPIRGAEEDEGE